MVESILNLEALYMRTVMNIIYSHPNTITLTTRASSLTPKRSTTLIQELTEFLSPGRNLYNSQRLVVIARDTIVPLFWEEDTGTSMLLASNWLLEHSDLLNVYIYIEQKVNK